MEDLKTHEKVGGGAELSGTKVLDLTKIDFQEVEDSMKAPEAQREHISSNYIDGYEDVVAGHIAKMACKQGLSNAHVDDIKHNGSSTVALRKKHFGK